MSSARWRRWFSVAVVMAGCAGQRHMDGDEMVGAHDAPGSEEIDPGWSSLGAGETNDSGPRGEILLAEAEREFTQRDPATSEYSHSTQVNEATGLRHVDCSGFVDYVLRRVQPHAYELIPHQGHIRPKASDFHQLFLTSPNGSQHPSGGPSWHQIHNVSHLRAGDLIAWLRPQDSHTRNSGHVMIARSGPTHGRQGEWLVQVIDSTEGPHAQDSREPGQTGIGHGVIGLYTDPTGHPVSFAWRGGVSTRLRTTDIAMGRLE